MTPEATKDTKNTDSKTLTCFTDKNMATEDLYVGQLHQLFRSCDCRGDGLLSKDELISLCDQLELTPSQSWYMIDRLIGSDPHIKVYSLFGDREDSSQLISCFLTL